MSGSSAGSLLLGIGGAFVGGLVGMPALGFAIGSSLGSALFPGQLPTIEGPRLDDTNVMSSAYGQPIPKVYGTNRVSGNLIWSSGITEHRHETTVGGKGGPSQTQVSYTYTASFAVALCQGPVRGVGRIWADGKLLTNNRFDLMEDQEGAGTDSFFRLIVSTIVSVVETIAGSYYTIYLGTSTQSPDPTIEAFEGANNCPAYRDLVYVVFTEMPLAKFGNRIPSITAEVMSVGTSTQDTITRIRNSSALNTDMVLETTTANDARPLFWWRLDDRIEVLAYEWATGDYIMIIYDVAGKYLSHKIGGSGGYTRDATFAYQYTEFSQTWYLIGVMYYIDKDMWLEIRGNNNGKPNGYGLIPSQGYPSSPSTTDYATYAYLRLGEYVAGYAGGSARNILEDFQNLEGGKYYHGIVWDPTRIYAMLFFGDDKATHGGTMYETKRWYLCKIKDQFYFEILDSGTIDWTGVAGGGYTEIICNKMDWFYAGSLDRDLRTLWFYYNAGAHDMHVMRIDPLTSVMSVVDSRQSTITIGQFYSTVLALESGVATFIAGDDAQIATLADTADHASTDLGSIVKDICQEVGLSLSDIDTTEIDGISVDGVKFEQTMSARAKLEMLQRCYQFDAAEIDYKIKFLLRSSMSTTALDSSDLIDGVETTRKEDTSLPLQVTVKHYNMKKNHQINVQQSKRIE